MTELEAYQHILVMMGFGMFTGFILVLFFDILVLKR